MWKLKKTCSHKSIKEIKGQFGPHQMKVVCVICNKWIKWGKKKRLDFVNHTN
jgi:hypothetical protein